MITIVPRYITAQNWASQTTIMLASIAPIPKLLDEAHWMGWAAYVVSLPELAAVNAPRPEGFSTWDSWATAFNVALRILPN